MQKKCYIQANRVIKDLIRRHPDFKVSYSISGCAIEQFKEYTPNVLRSFQRLADTGQVEFLAETTHHSLSSLYDPLEFKHQVKTHHKLIKKTFGQKPKVFRNTELIYNNQIAKQAENLGYKAILAEGWDPILQWRSPNYVYHASGTKRMKLILKNYKLSDDIAFRFSNKNWNGWPLTAEKYAGWLSSIKGDTINLFMDYETLGEHHWADTGIFNFWRSLPKELIDRNVGFVHPSELIKQDAKDTLDIPNTISWADTERDTTAWLGNDMQKSAIKILYGLKDEVFCN